MILFLLLIASASSLQEADPWGPYFLNDYSTQYLPFSSPPPPLENDYPLFGIDDPHIYTPYIPSSPPAPLQNTQLLFGSNVMSDQSVQYLSPLPPPPFRNIDQLLGVDYSPKQNSQLTSRSTLTNKLPLPPQSDEDAYDIIQVLSQNSSSSPSVQLSSFPLVQNQGLGYSVTQNSNQYSLPTPTSISFQQQQQSDDLWADILVSDLSYNNPEDLSPPPAAQPGAVPCQVANPSLTPFASSPNWNFSVVFQQQHLPDESAIISYFPAATDQATININPSLSNQSSFGNDYPNCLPLSRQSSPFIHSPPLLPPPPILPQFSPSPQVLVSVLTSRIPFLCQQTYQGCQCQSKWEYHFDGVKTINFGCANPDSDPFSSWCVIESGSCPQTANVGKLEQLNSWLQYEHFDRCLPDCPKSSGRKAVDSVCHRTNLGCTCQELWSYKGKEHYGCQNPDNDPLGKWCIVIDGSCAQEPTRELIQQYSGIVTDKWDYCGSICD